MINKEPEREWFSVCLSIQSHMDVLPIGSAAIKVGQDDRTE